MSLQPISPEHTALILAGAVANGAFEAGAIDVLVKAGHSFRPIVAASSGGLNGTLFAAGIRSGKEPFAASELVRLWETSAGLTQAFNPSLRDLLAGRGFSDQDA